MNKRLGQHLLIDGNIRNKILSTAGLKSQDKILEIGPGLGALTHGFLEAGAEVWAVEKDRGFCRLLENELNHPSFHLLCDDALRVQYRHILPQEKAPFKVIANLPYNITTPLLMHLLTTGDLFSMYLLMVQKEAAERWVARPGSKDYGAVTLKVQYFLETNLLFNVGPGSFFPKPEVESSVVLLSPRSRPPYAVDDQAFFLELITAAFAQRRKTLMNNLKHLVGDGTILEEALNICSIDARARGEELDMKAFACLAQALYSLKEGG